MSSPRRSLKGLLPLSESSKRRSLNGLRATSSSTLHLALLQGPLSRSLSWSLSKAPPSRRLVNPLK